MNWLLFVAVLTAECLVATAKSQAFDQDILFRLEIQYNFVQQKINNNSLPAHENLNGNCVPNLGYKQGF